MPEKIDKSAQRAPSRSWLPPSLLAILIVAAIALSAYFLTKQDFAAWVETNRDVRIYTYNSLTGRVCEVRFDKQSVDTQRQCK